MKQNRMSAATLCFAAMMAAMVFVVTFFRFPLLGSKVHFANAVCLLCGMLLGPVTGGIAAGLGSALYDAFSGYDLINTLITFVSKFAMAWVCGILMGRRHQRGGRPGKTVPAALLGALTYIALYMIKTYVFNRFVYGYPLDTVGAAMISKLIPALINGGVAVIAAPLFYHAILPVLRSGGLLKYLDPEE